MEGLDYSLWNVTILLLHLALQPWVSLGLRDNQWLLVRYAAILFLVNKVTTIVNTVRTNVILNLIFI
jgi:hypothetical protein